MNIITILANGVGSRFNSNIPKQFHKIHDRMVIDYVIDAIAASQYVDKILIAMQVGEYGAFLSSQCRQYDIGLIDGGATRNQTLKRVLDHIQEHYTCEKLIVCDAVRPMITSELLDQYFADLDEADAVVTAQKITDSLGSYDFKEVDRERYYLMQSPEAFSFPMLYQYFDAESSLTEVTQQLPDAARIKLHFGFENNFKLTYPEDLRYMEAVLSYAEEQISGTAMLQSVHRLNRYLQVNYQTEASVWERELTDKVPSLLQKWRISGYSLVKTSHFGLVFLAESQIYGACAIKIIPPFIGRYNAECNCYRSLSPSYMCELLDYDDACSALLLKQCEPASGASFEAGKQAVHDFFKQVLIEDHAAPDSTFHDYEKELKTKASEQYGYRSVVVSPMVEKAISLYDSAFADANRVLTHGDLHRYNLMAFGEKLVAIDPIGYVAPVELEIARYIGTEINELPGDILENVKALIACFSDLADPDRLVSMLYIDMVFRMHNSLFENETYELTDTWIKDIQLLEQWMLH